MKFTASFNTRLIKKYLFLFCATSLFAENYPVYKLPESSVMQMAIQCGKEQNVLPAAIYAISKIESDHNIYAYNPSNKNGTADMGLMQINSCWLPELRKNGLYDDRLIYDPVYNMRVGSWILKQCINRFGRSWKSIDCYNKGPGKAQNHGLYVRKFIEAFNAAPEELK